MTKPPLSRAPSAERSSAQGVALEPSFVYSPQQEALLSTVGRSGNLILEARAGTGKTTTLVEYCRHHVARGLPPGLFLAFNKAIATEITAKLASAGITSREIKAATFHSVGFQAWTRHASGVKVVGEKLDLLADALYMPRMYQPFVKRLVSLAKQSLIGVGSSEMDDDLAWRALVEHHRLLDDLPETDEGEIDEEEFLSIGLAWAYKLLRSSIDDSLKRVDFDDMIYMPLYSQLRLWQYDLVLIDEAQDTNFARRLMAQRALRPGGRLIAVGDRHQAIYGFTGADADALDLLRDAFACETLPLTVTYRCARSIVREANEFVPDLEARPGAEEGTVAGLSWEAFRRLVPEEKDAILCRVTRPLVTLAFDYLRRGIPCHIEGRAIGASLISLARKWRSLSTIGELRSRLIDYLDDETNKLLTKHKRAAAAALHDKVTTLLAIADALGDDTPIPDLVSQINRMFKDSEGLPRQTLTLSTVHKAKGREWDRVYLLGRHELMPHFMAKADWELEQENNLIYVAITRARSKLIYVEALVR